MCGCENNYFLGCFSPCECVILGALTADMAGEWRFEYSYPTSGTFIVSRTFDLDDPLSIPGQFNEDNRVTVNIFRPDDSRYTYLDKDCFVFEIHVHHEKGTYSDCKTPEPAVCSCIFYITPILEQTTPPIYAYSITPEPGCSADIYEYTVKWDGQNSTLSGQDAVFLVQITDPGTHTVTVTPKAYNCVIDPFTFDIIVP
jgi:hypothetical protein